MKKTLILVAVSVVVLAVVLFSPKKGKKKTNVEKVVLIDNKRKIESISIEEKEKAPIKILSKGISYTLMLEENKELPVLNSVVNSIIGALEKKYDAQLISRKVSTYSLYDLDAASRFAVKFEFVDGKETLYFGADAPGYKGIYFLKDKKVYKLPGVERSDLLKTRQDLVDKSIFSFSSSSVKKLEIIGKKKSYSLVKIEKTEKKKKGETNNTEEKKITIWKDKKSKKEYENFKISDYLDKLSSLNCEKFDLSINTQSVEKKFIKKYIITTEKETFTLFIAKDKKAFASNQKYTFLLSDNYNRQLTKELK